jgi:4-amino-4-deoxy-L-arabinose transferase-like glycosyltransferase/membrane-associated phospholipid phosphatase
MPWLQELDESLFRFINHTLSNPLFDVVMPWLSRNGLFGPMVALAVVVLLWRGRGRAVVWLLMLGLIISITDGLVCTTLKQAFGRVRPCSALEGVQLLLGCGTSGSMPSAHAGNTFALAMAAFLYWRRSGWVLFPLAAAVSFSRVYNGVHYPADVVAGAIVGMAIAFAVVFGMNALWCFVGARWFPLWLARFPSLVWQVGSTPPIAETPVTSSVTNDQHWLRAGYVAIALITVARWIYLASGLIELSEDEAYQWVWSKHLALSDYSKPLLIAVTQSLGTSFWGDTAFGVRFFSPLIACTLGCMLLRFFAREVNARAGFFLVLIMTTTPLLAVGATLMTVDPLAVLFWTAAMLSGWRAVQEDSRTGDWLWTGLWMGLGFLSKYSSPLMWLCWAVFFVLWPAARKQLRRPGPYLALGVNLIFTLPVILWNAQHDWVTFVHVASHGGAGRVWHPTLRYLGEFLGAEFALLNPVYFTAAVIAAVAMWRTTRLDARQVFFFSMGAPVFLLYAVLSIKSRVQPNWIAPAILPMLIVMVLYWEQRWREGARGIRPWLATGLVAGLAMVVFTSETRLISRVTRAPLPPALNPLVRVRGHGEMARAVGQARRNLARDGKPVFIIGDHYGITSLLAFYLPEAKARVADAPIVFCKPSATPRNQYYFWPGYEQTHKGRNALYVRRCKPHKPSSDQLVKRQRNQTDPHAMGVRPEPPPEWLAKQFSSVKSTGLHVVRYRGQVFHVIEIYECRDLL